MTKYNILVQQPRPRAQVYVDENTTKRLVFDFGEASFEARAKFKQMAENLTRININNHSARTSSH